MVAIWFGKHRKHKTTYIQRMDWFWKTFGDFGQGPAAEAGVCLKVRFCRVWQLILNAQLPLKRVRRILRLRPCRRPPLWLQPEVSEGFEDMQGLQRFNLDDPSDCWPASPQPADVSSNKTTPDNFGVDPRIRVTTWQFSIILGVLGNHFGDKLE